MIIATTQFSLQKVHSPTEFWGRFEALLSQAKSAKASVVVFPEYFSLSLLMCQTEHADFKQALHGSLPHSQEVLSKARALASTYQMAIVLGTLPWVENQKLINRSFFITSDGKTIAQDKIFMTRFEDEVWKVKGGEPLVHIFDWQQTRCAILTCYDSEFAVLSQSLARSGVELLFVPSCTDTEHGYWRVRHCCEARAIENQLFVAMSSIVLGDPKFEEIDAHYGRSAIFSPCDTGFQANGLLAEGETNREGLCIATVEIQQIKKVRQTGSVLNLRDAIRVPFVNTKTSVIS